MEYINNNGYKYVGGTPYNHGAKYKSLDLLFKDYYKLLVKCLLSEGIQFSIDDILGKIKLENEGFVLYTNHNSAFESFNDSMEKRLVSADFVLLMFDRACMSNFYNIVKANPNISVSLEEDPSYIIEQYIKNGRATINDSNSLLSNKNYISSLYSLIRKIIEYSMCFQLHYENINKVQELERSLDEGKRDYDDFSEEENDLFSNRYRYSGRYDDFPEFYFSLGCFSNFVRREALNNIYKMKNSVNIPTNLTKEQSISYCKGDPVVFDSHFELMTWNEDLLYGELGEEFDWQIALDEGIKFIGENVLNVKKLEDEDLFGLSATGFSPRGRGRGGAGGLS